MRIPCYLREVRGKHPMADMVRASGVSSARLSQIERGVMIPFDREIEVIEKAYGIPIEEWYPARTLLVLESDPRGE